MAKTFGTDEMAYREGKTETQGDSQVPVSVTKSQHKSKQRIQLNSRCHMKQPDGEGGKMTK